MLRVLLASANCAGLLGITRISPLLDWLYSENGYRLLAPLFRLFGAVGVEGHERRNSGRAARGEFHHRVVHRMDPHCLAEPLKNARPSTTAIKTPTSPPPTPTP